MSVRVTFVRCWGRLMVGVELALDAGWEDRKGRVTRFGVYSGTTPEAWGLHIVVGKRLFTAHWLRSPAGSRIVR
jgi:hypothetical protein